MDDPVVAHYQQFERALRDLADPGRFDPGHHIRLERIRHLLELLGNPQHAFPAIHVGGTAGKGSTAATAAAVLAAAGYRTGLHLSPALQIINEGFRINNRMVSTTRLAALLDALKPAVTQVAAENPAGRPSAFEIQVALACCLFRQAAVDVAVVEVGLGGAADATSVVPAAVAVITSVGLDHTDVFGDSIAAVAHGEAGIIKPGQRVISGVQQPEARQIVAGHCRAVGAELGQMGVAFDMIAGTDGQMTIHTPSGVLPDLQPGLSGAFQFANTACAIAAVQALPGFAVPEAAIRQGLAQVDLPGRMEVVGQHPLVVLDGAHNPDKLNAAWTAIEQMCGHRRRIVVFGLKAGKDVRANLACVMAGTDLLILTAFRPGRLWEPVDPSILAGQVRAHPRAPAVRVLPDPLTAIATALDLARPDDVIVVTGSLYLVGDIRARWYPPSGLLAQLERQDNPEA